MINGKLYTAKEVANMFRVELETVYQWKFYGKIKGIKVNGRLLFKEEDLLQMLA